MRNTHRIDHNSSFVSISLSTNIYSVHIFMRFCEFTSTPKKIYIHTHACLAIYAAGNRRWEQYLGERGVKTSKKINFEDYRKRIADPSFVDNLEVNYYVERDTISSIENMETLNSWPSSSVASFQEQCEKNGDLIVKPLTEEDKQRQKESLENAELYDEKMKLMAQELLKDFEQIDAERMMLGQETMLMQLSQHPQYAEALEDMYTAKQNYLDYAMLPIHRDYVKREKLAAIQDEERRKAFLERFEYGTKIYNGMDCSVPP